MLQKYPANQLIGPLSPTFSIEFYTSQGLSSDTIVMMYLWDIFLEGDFPPPKTRIAPIAKNRPS